MGVLTFGALLYLTRRFARWLYPKASLQLPRWTTTATSHEEHSAATMRPRRVSRRKSERLFKLLLLVFIVGFYYIWATYLDPPTPFVRTSPRTVQNGIWKATPADDASNKATYVKDAMRHSFSGYRDYALGYDDIDPSTGAGRGEKDVKAGYLLEAAPALALMQMWDEFEVVLRQIVDAIDFSKARGLIDPADTTSRYLGALVSLLEMVDAGLIPEEYITKEHRAVLVEKTVQLAQKLLPAFGSKTGLPYPRIDVKTGEGFGRPQPQTQAQLQAQTDKSPHEREYAIEPNHVASMLLENVALSRLLSLNEYRRAAERAWSGLNAVNSLQSTSAPILLKGPIDVFTGKAEGAELHWDAGHDEYYTTLLNSIMLGISSSLSTIQHARFNESANALRWNLTSRSAPTDKYLIQHLYLGQFDGSYYYNEQSQHACSAASTLILGGSYLQVYSFTIFGQALLEGCHHIFHSSPRTIGPEKWSWLGMPLSPNGTYAPTTKRSRAEVEANGFWTVDARFTWNPNYFKSLFYAWRVTGEIRYREWAWEAFKAVQRNCKTQYGYAGLKDVMDASEKGLASKKWTDEVKSGDVVQSLRWLWLTFSDTEVGSLDKWVFTSSGNMLKRG